MTIQYFLYARKSEESEERQILSIEAQLTELKTFAQKEKLIIKETFIEAMTAKKPGRPIFNQMISRMEKGEAQGIIAWHPDRLARNSIDGGRIIYCLDTGQIKALKFPTFWFENTPQGKFMMNIAFGQSKYYVDNLSENIRRGIRQKLRRGEWPSFPPIGYKSSSGRRNFTIDPVNGHLIKKLIELYATGEYSTEFLKNWSAENGIRNRNGNPLSRSAIFRILTNPFYYGLMVCKGEAYPGKHPSLITKELFDQVQEVARRNGKTHEVRKHHFPFLKLATCKSCGCSITAERQKGYHYYRCTRKKGLCTEPYIREEVLDQQITQAINNAALPEEGYQEMLAHLGLDKSQASQMLQQEQTKIGKPLQEVQSKLEKLLDLHLNGHVSQEEYVSRKEKLLNERITLDERLSQIKDHGNIWLEPLAKFMETANHANQMATDKNLAAKREFLKKIGSNFRLASQTLEFSYVFPWALLKKSAPIRRWCSLREYPSGIRIPNKSVCPRRSRFCKGCVSHGGSPPREQQTEKPPRQFFRLCSLYLEIRTFFQREIEKKL